MSARLLLLLTILALPVGCAPGYYDTQPAYQPEAAPQWSTRIPRPSRNIEQRIRWENYESEPPSVFLASLKNASVSLSFPSSSWGRELERQSFIFSVLEFSSCLGE